MWLLERHRIIVYAERRDKLIKEPLTSDVKSLENKCPGNEMCKMRDP